MVIFPNLSRAQIKAKKAARVILANSIYQPALHAGALSGDLRNAGKPIPITKASVMNPRNSICFAPTVYNVCSWSSDHTATFSARTGHVIFIVKMRLRCHDGFLHTALGFCFEILHPLHGVSQRPPHKSLPVHTHSPSRRASRAPKSTLAFQAVRELKTGTHRCSFYVFCLRGDYLRVSFNFILYV